MQLTEMELLHIGDQLNAEALAIAKYADSARQSTDPKLQQLYSNLADRHRGHYETLLRNVQNHANQRQY
ncbi:MAG: spore coat protein [Desulfotomaculaceae bacterium]|nr:spore coat protein [Desulfotomaculaceae bacterium]